MSSHLVSANSPKTTVSSARYSYRLPEDFAASNGSGTRTPSAQFIESVYDVVSLVLETLDRIATPHADDVAAEAQTLRTMCMGLDSSNQAKVMEVVEMVGHLGKEFTVCIQDSGLLNNSAEEDELLQLQAAVCSLASPGPSLWLPQLASATAESSPHSFDSNAEDNHQQFSSQLGPSDAITNTIRQWCRYTKELSSFMEKRVSLEAEFAGKLLKLARSTKDSISVQERLPWLDVVDQQLDEDIQCGRHCVEMHQPTMMKKCVEAIQLVHDQCEHAKRDLQANWTADCKKLEKKLAEAEVQLKKCRRRYHQSCADLSKLDGDNGPRSACEKNEKNDKMRAIDSSQRKILDSECNYKQSIEEANTILQQLTTHCDLAVRQLKPLLAEASASLKAALSVFFTKEDWLWKSRLQKMAAIAFGLEDACSDCLAHLLQIPLFEPFVFQGFDAQSNREFRQKGTDQNGDSFESDGPVRGGSPRQNAWARRDMEIGGMEREIKDRGSSSPVMASSPVLRRKGRKLPRMMSLPASSEIPRLTEKFQMVGGYLNHFTRRSDGPNHSRTKVSTRSPLADGSHCSKSRCLYDYEEDVPPLVEQCINEVASRGLKEQGIYRLSGVKSKVEQIWQKYESGSRKVDLSTSSPHEVAGALKMFFRQLAEPLIPWEIYNDFIQLAKDNQPIASSEGKDGLVESVNPGNCIREHRALMSKLPTKNYNTCKMLLLHLAEVTKHSEVNNMTPGNLAIIFGPTLLRSSLEPLSLNDMPLQVTSIQTLIRTAHQVFAEDDPLVSEETVGRSSHFDGYVADGEEDENGTHTKSRWKLLRLNFAAVRRKGKLRKCASVDGLSTYEQLPGSIVTGGKDYPTLLRSQSVRRIAVSQESENNGLLSEFSKGKGNGETLVGSFKSELLMSPTDVLLSIKEETFLYSSEEEEGGSVLSLLPD